MYRNGVRETLTNNITILDPKKKKNCKESNKKTLALLKLEGMSYPLPPQIDVAEFRVIGGRNQLELIFADQFILRCMQIARRSLTIT